MSKTVITEDMVNDSNSPLIGMTMLDGEDRVTVGTVYDSAEDAMVAKSLRLPGSLYDAAIKHGHPNGFSGVVREALEAFLKPSDNEVRHALDVIKSALDLNQAA